MNKSVIIRTVSVAMVFFISFLGAEKILSLEKTKERTAELEQEAQAEGPSDVPFSEKQAVSKKIVVKSNWARNDRGQTLIEEVPHINQLPELQRGCEVTSLAMLLQYEGIQTDKMTLAQEIYKIPFRDANYVRGNPYDGFVGDIYTFSKSGYGVYHGPIAKLAEKYLPGKIKDITGQPAEALYQMIDSGSPVWVITNSTYAPLPESEFTVWETNTGKVKITYREHSAVIVGYDEKSVYINDPLAPTPYKAVPREAFEQAWVQMGSQAIGIRK